ncbi:MAG: hypothetical protein JNK82_31535 [Myxococcaceae bacterium]|nr:hypothetical protein [Myxococcaceae bacterium]
MAIRVNEGQQWVRQIEGMARRSRLIEQGQSGQSELSPSDFERMLRTVEKEGGPRAAAALKVAYERAKASRGPMPTYDDVARVLADTEANFQRFDFNGDGLLDDREASGFDRHRAGYSREIYGLAPAATFVNDRVTVSATVAQINRAMELVDCVQQRARELLEAGSAATHADAVAQAAKELGYPGAIDVLLANPPPNAYEVKRYLLGADGTPVVDVRSPFDPPTRSWDGVVTNLEVERNASTRGNGGLQKLLVFAAGLPVPAAPFEPPGR